MIIKTIPLGNLGANFYLIKDEETNDIFAIDPGAEADVAVNAINELNGNLRYIILTHAHVDHICALDEVKKCFDVPVVIHEMEASALNDTSVNLCFLLGEKCPVTCADIAVKDAQTLPFGSSQIEFIHTPGHTKGSMCILYSDVLFSGDTLFSGSIGRTDFPGGSSLISFTSSNFASCFLIWSRICSSPVTTTVIRENLLSSVTPTVKLSML